MIHVAIRRQVRPGREMEFEAAVQRFFQDTAADDHHHGAILLKPEKMGDRCYGIVRVFPDEGAMAKFYQSAAFQEWQTAVAPIVEGQPEYRQLHGLEAFFDLGTSHPDRWKMALLTWLAVWLISALYRPLLAPLLEPLPPWVQSALMTAAVVATLAWGVMPLVTKGVRPWLRRKGRTELVPDA